MAPNTKSAAPKQKRRRNRKSRTEVSSSSESDISSGSESETGEGRPPRKDNKTDNDSRAPSADAESAHVLQPAPKEDFSSLYLRKVTVELADDLDKIRQAGDFNERALPMLVHALKQGESIFSAEEKAKLAAR